MIINSEDTHGDLVADLMKALHVIKGNHDICNFVVAFAFC